MPKKYRMRNWESIFRKRDHFLKRGRDFDGSIRHITWVVNRAAKRLGYAVRITKMTENAIKIRRLKFRAMQKQRLEAREQARAEEME